MNKYIKIFVFLIIGILQLTLMPLLQIKGMIPNLVLIGIVVLAITDLFEDAFYLAATGGLILDWAGPLFFGFYTIIFICFVLVIKFLLQKVLPEINSLVILFATFVFAIVLGFFENILYHRWPSFNLLTYGVYTAILACLFFLCLQKFIGRNTAIKV